MGWPGPIDVDVKRLRMDNLATLVVAPSSPEGDRLIRQYRDDVSAHLGVRAPNHLTYGFHISLAYRLFELEDAEWAAANSLVEEINKKLATRKMQIRLEPPEFCSFPDMSEFVKVDGHSF